MTFLPASRIEHLFSASETLFTTGMSLFGAKSLMRSPPPNYYSCVVNVNFKSTGEMADPWKAWKTQPSRSTAARETLAGAVPSHISHNANIRGSARS